MNLPSGLIFYLDFKYNNQQFGGFSISGSSLYGGDGSDLGSTNVGKNGLYGSGKIMDIPLTTKKNVVMKLLTTSITT